MRPPLQRNVRTRLTGEDRRKYEVGRRLRFTGYNPEESLGDEADAELQFRFGDVLVVLDRNACGMGIDVRRESDGHADMVWPEEVEVIA